MEHAPNFPESRNEKVSDEEALASLSRNGYENNEVYIAWVRGLEEAADTDQSGEEGRFEVNKRIAEMLRKAGYIEEAYDTLYELQSVLLETGRTDMAEEIQKKIEELLN